MSRTCREALNDGAALLLQAGIESPRLEARLLLAKALNSPIECWLADWEAEARAPGYWTLVARRAAREPLALILGRREFWSLEFAVTPDTLVPRPESETLIEAALAIVPDRTAALKILDLGTGTGCLLLAALSEHPGSFGVGVDLIPAAAALAARNAARLGLLDRCAFLSGDWAAALRGRFDLILCNPPYIPSKTIASLMPELAHEPSAALDGGVDGLAAYRRIIPLIPGLLAPQGIAILEAGEGQAAAIQVLGIAAGLTTCHKEDLAGTPRAIILHNALPQKNRLAEPEGESSFEPVAGDRHKAAFPGASAGSASVRRTLVDRKAPASTNVEGLKPGRSDRASGRKREGPVRARGTPPASSKKA